MFSFWSHLRYNPPRVITSLCFYFTIMQKGHLLLTVILGVVTLLPACNSSKHSKIKRLPGTWQVSPVAIDGDNKDWPSPYPEYDEKAQIGYAVSNDKENLYITVETGDPATQLKILREGLTVWIDRTGDKEEVTAINYPIPANAGAKKEREHHQQAEAGQGQQGLGTGRQQQLRMDMEDKVRAALTEAKEYSLQGFKSCNLQYNVFQVDTCGVTVRMGLDADNELVWEAKVPFKSFYFKPRLARPDKGKAITVCFETTAMKRPPGQPASSGHGGGSGFRPSVGFGGMGMGMGGMGGGMYRGGGGRSRAQGPPDLMEPAYKSTKTYKKTGLAYQE